MNEQLGPRQAHYPARNFNTCSGCEFFKHRLVKSGLDPIYRNDCKHPQAEYQETSMLAMTGNLPSDDDHETPEWCPFLKKK